MKKDIVVLFVLFSVFTYAQSSKLRFGVHGGINYSGLRGYTIPSTFEQQYDESAAFAYLGGVSLEYQLQEKLSLRVELNYERKSQKADNSMEIRFNFDQEPQLYNFTTRKNYDYLIVPILLKYRFTDKNSFFVNGGPFIGYLLKSTLTNDLEIPNFETPNEDMTKDSKKTDFGFSAGVGKNFELGNSKMIHVEIRNNLGLAKINKNDVWNGGHISTNSVNFIVGFSFN